MLLDATFRTYQLFLKVEKNKKKRQNDNQEILHRLTSEKNSSV